MSVRNLEALLRPRSVAVIGASERPRSIGALVLGKLLAGGFAGPVWPVNPRHARVGELPAWPDVASLPQVPDLAVLCTPAATVPGLIAELGRKGTRAAVVLTAGPPAPTDFAQSLRVAARPTLLRVLGPNCLGLLVPGQRLNASFAHTQALPGKLAFVSQSGALATAMLDWANSRGIGFSHFISLGDSADVDVGDLLDYLASDSDTSAILLYLESVSAARKFMSAGRAAARNKPVIVVKAGRAPAGARAAASHTGALAGSDRVFDAALRRAGMLRVATLEDLFDAAQTLARARPLHGPRLAIVTNGGGAGVLAADAMAARAADGDAADAPDGDAADAADGDAAGAGAGDAEGRGTGASAGTAELATLSPASLAALDAVLPPNWSHANPVDLIGDAPIARYVAALEVLLKAPEVDAVLLMHAPTAVVPSADIAQACLPLLRAATKPVLSCWLGADAVLAARQACEAAGVPSYATPERAVAAFSRLAQHRHNQAVLRQVPHAAMPGFVPDRAAARALIEAALAAGLEQLDETQAKALLAAYGIPVVATRSVPDVEAAVLAAAQIGYPVVLKIRSAQISHKSDVGGVALNLRNTHELRSAALAMQQRVAQLRPQASLQGFTLQAQVHRPQAHELILGAATDPLFGPVLLFGQGGTAVELLRDRAVALPPLNTLLADDLIARTRVAALLHGYRDRPAVDVAALRDSLIKLSQLVCDHAELAELDINPLWADAQGVIALDARVRLQARAGPAADRLAILPYPDGLEERITLAARELLLRPIRPEDEPALREFYAQATPGDLRLRFFASRREVPDSELARFSQIDYDREMSFVAMGRDQPPPLSASAAVGQSGAGGQGASGGSGGSGGSGSATASIATMGKTAGPHMLGEVRAACDPDKQRAEFAIQVRSGWQGRGLGHVLLDKLLRHLRAQGVREVQGECLRENQAMAALARRLGFAVGPAGSGDGLTLRLKL